MLYYFVLLILDCRLFFMTVLYSRDRSTRLRERSGDKVDEDEPPAQMRKLKTPTTPPESNGTPENKSINPEDSETNDEDMLSDSTNSILGSPMDVCKPLDVLCPLGNEPLFNQSQTRVPSPISIPDEQQAKMNEPLACQSIASPVKGQSTTPDGPILIDVCNKSTTLPAIIGPIRQFHPPSKLLRFGFSSSDEEASLMETESPVHSNRPHLETSAPKEMSLSSIENAYTTTKHSKRRPLTCSSDLEDIRREVLTPQDSDWSGWGVDSGQGSYHSFDSCVPFSTNEVLHSNPRSSLFPQTQNPSSDETPINGSPDSNPALRATTEPIPQSDNPSSLVTIEKTPISILPNRSILATDELAPQIDNPDLSETSDESCSDISLDLSDPATRAADEPLPMTESCSSSVTLEELSNDISLFPPTPATLRANE